MVADIARVTYDPTRQYRSLIYQQGRVTLEADNNEAETIASEARRLETVDILGPATAIGNGYQVTAGSDGQGFSIGKGVFYLGGWRLELEKPFQLPFFDRKPEHGLLLTSSAIGLLITEQSVGAVEDQDLREVALGGPDSAGRSRLHQTFPILHVLGENCATAWETITSELSHQGITIGADNQLLSSARLLAGFTGEAPNADPCQPSAAGGYLGADNQMVRITVTEYNAANGQLGGSGRLLWGWNNASLLYRATAPGSESGATDTTLTLSTVPVDQEHAPLKKMWVEILRSEKVLGDNNFIAEPQGVVREVVTGYSFDQQTITIKGQLPAGYQTSPNPLFIRLWQAEIPFLEGKETKLDDSSGILVTITMTALPSLAARPYWHFAVRPAMPTKIYPGRYQDAPQPPDGPRQWLTDLAIILRDSGTPLNCPPSYPPAETETGCCGLTLDPAGVAARGGLQAVVDSLGDTGGVLSLKTGIYKLKRQLRLNRRNRNLIIEGCAPGVILQADADASLDADYAGNFKTGLITIDTENLMLQNLSLRAPAIADAIFIPIEGGDAKTAADDTTKGKGGASIFGISILGGNTIKINNCIIELNESTGYREVFGCGVITAGATENVSITANRFLGINAAAATLFGVLAFPASNSAETVMRNWQIDDNQFQNLAGGVFAIARFGLVRCNRNIVNTSYLGLVFIDANMGATGKFTIEAVDNANAGRNVALGQAAHAAFQPDFVLATIDRASATFTGEAAPATASQISEAARQAISAQMAERASKAYKAMTPSQDEKPDAAQTVKTVSIDTSAYTKLETLSQLVELHELTVLPGIRIADNEIFIVAQDDPAWTGIGARMALGEISTVMITGNRVVMPSDNCFACNVMAATGIIITSNIFSQSDLVAGVPGLPSLSVMTDSPDLMVASNVVRFSELIRPGRDLSPNALDWDQLNTVVDG